jgi:flagellar biosynthesis protein
MYQADKEAVALEYGANKTPIVTAKGEAELAEVIIEEAKKQGIYIAEDPKLLAALAQLDIEDEIPEELFTAVAVILSWAYWLKDMEPGDEKKKDSSKKKKFKVRGQV